MRQVEKTKAFAKLQSLAERGRKLRPASTDDPGFGRWINDCVAAVRNIFGEPSSQLEAFKDIGFTPVAFSLMGGDDAKWQAALNTGVGSAVVLLDSLAGEIDDYWPEAAPSERFSSPRAEPTGDTVFIIHGRDVQFAEVVARFVEKRGLNAIILHEQPSKGRTIIEKFEQHAQPCAFAIALFTSDDEGRLRGSSDDLQPRARQNVILETGYFAGALGRERVAILCDPTIERPSDFEGMVYILIADDGWREVLGNELDAAGLAVASRPR